MLSNHTKKTPISWIYLLTKKYLKTYKDIPLLGWERVLATSIEAIFNGICFFLSIYFVDKLHLSITTVGIALSFYGLGKAIGGLLSGKLCDKISPNIVILISLSVEASAFVILSTTTNPLFLIITLFILGIASYGFITANNVFILSQTSEENIKLKILSMLQVGSNFGIGLSAIFVSIFFKYGFNYLFLGAAISLFLIVIYFVINEKKYREYFTPALKNTVVDMAILNKQSNQKILWLTLMCLFLAGLTIGQLGTTYTLYINTKFSSDNINAVSFLFLLNSFLIVFFQTPLINYFSNFNKILMTGLGGFLMGTGMCMLSFSYVYTTAVFACLVYTLGEMIFFSMAQLVAYQSGRETRKGETLGLFRMIFALSVFIGPTLGSLVYQNISPESVWYACGLIGLLCLAFGLKYA